MITDIIDDTICAISTPPGIGGIAVIRVSGPEAIAIVNSVWHGRDLSAVGSHTAHLGELAEAGKEAVDQCVATVYRGPHSYTGEDTVELAIHGSKWIQREVLSLLQRNGCRMAEAGEYTRRAVMNGRMDLAQAEGVADVIASTSRAAHRIAMSQMKGGISRRLASLREQLVHLSALLELELDFSEEDVEFANRSQLIDTAEQIRDELTRLYNSFSRGNAIKEGIPVAIVGPTNVGKSSLLNALLDDDRAIVSDIHGTTRDTIEETLEVGDYLFRFIDTAGLRETLDPIERIGIERSRKALSQARIVIALVDATTVRDWHCDISSMIPAEIAEQTADVIVGINKIDLLDKKTQQELARIIPSSVTLSTESNQAPKDQSTKLIPKNQSINPIHKDQCINPILKNQSINPIPKDQCINPTSIGQSIKLNPKDQSINPIPKLPIIALSATQGTGIKTLLQTIHSIAAYSDNSIGERFDIDNSASERSDIMVTNLRQAEALRQALDSIQPLIDGLQNGLETDLAAQHLRETLTHLATITGEIPSTEILNSIFSSFCVGK